MAGKTISILGCGWLGTPLAERLVRAGYTVKGSTRTPDKLEQLREQGIRPYLINMEPDLNDAGDFFDADVLFLNIPPGRRDPQAPKRFPRQIRSVQAAVGESRVELVVFASSTSVYPDLNRIIDEEDAGGEVPPASQALLEAEDGLRRDRRFETTVLRFAGLYGYERKIGRFLAGREAVENGGAPVNLVHRDDCIQIASLIIARGIAGKVLNVCAEGHPTREALYVRRARQLGLEPPRFIEKGETRFKIVSNDRLKALLDYEFAYPDPMQDAP